MAAWLHPLPRLVTATPVLLAALVLPGSAAGAPQQAAAPAETPRHSLFSPTPRESVRDLATDRPDQTESPYTVDAGHVQVEMDLFRLVFDRGRSGSGEARLVAWSVAPFNAKLGLLDNVDLQFVIDTYAGSRLDDEAAGAPERASGFGNVATRLKWNLWGNDGGRTAFAMMPFVRWPLPASSLRNGRTEGGVIFPFTVNVGRGWDVGAMTEVDFLANPAGGYDAHFVNSVTAGHSLTERLGMFVEVIAVTGLGSGAGWLGQFDVGCTYALRETVRLDFGSNFGLTDAAPMVHPFVGLSVKF